MNFLKTIDKLIYDSVINNHPGNSFLPYLLITQSQFESGYYKKSPAAKVNNFWGLKWNIEYASFGGYDSGIVSSEGDTYCGFPTVSQGILGLLYLYRDGGRYSGILRAQTVNDFVNYLQAGGYTDAKGIAQYRASLPTMIQKVILEHPEVIELSSDGQKKNQLWGSYIAGGINHIVAVRHQLFGF